MNNTIYIVYVTYFNEVEEMFAFTDYEQATAKQLELSLKWVNNDSWHNFLNKYSITTITIDVISDYFMEVEDDSYIGIKQVQLAKSTNRIQALLEEDILETYCNSEYHDPNCIRDFVRENADNLTEDEIDTIEWLFDRTEFPNLNYKN